MHERQLAREESESEPEEYRYIVPSGVHVVFRDHDGQEIARYVLPANTVASASINRIIALVIPAQCQRVADLEI